MRGGARKRAAWIALLAAACSGRAPDPTLLHVPSDAALYVRAESWDAVLAAVPSPALAMGRREIVPPGLEETGFPPERLDGMRPLAAAWRQGEGNWFLVVPDANPSAAPPSLARGWSAESAPNGYLVLWAGSRPDLGPLEDPEFPEGTAQGRIFVDRGVDRFAAGGAPVPGADIEGALERVRAGLALWGIPPDSPLQPSGAWVETIRSLGRIDFALRRSEDRFEVRARVRPVAGGAVERFARAARAAPHTLAGFLSKERGLLYVESGGDAATFATLFRWSALLGIPPAPLTFGGTEDRVLALHDGRAGWLLGISEGGLFVESLAGLRDPRAARALLDSDEVADAIEEALATRFVFRDPVYEPRAGEHAGIVLSRLRVEIAEEIPFLGRLHREGPLAKALELLTDTSAAVVGDVLVMASGADSERRVRALIDRVRSGRLDRPSLAVEIGGSRHRIEGFVLDVAEWTRLLTGARVPAGLGVLGGSLEIVGGRLEWRGWVDLRMPLGDGFPR